MTNLEGKVDAIMMTDDTYYAYIYRKRGVGEYEPERAEIGRDRYYELLHETPALYFEDGYTAFRLDRQARDERELDETYDAFLAGTGRV